MAGPLGAPPSAFAPFLIPVALFALGAAGYWLLLALRRRGPFGGR